MSLTRNPWHVREYKVEELRTLMRRWFFQVEMNGVYGNEKVMRYYERNKASVKAITRFDIFNLQYRLPRRWLQVPYDFMNRLNRRRLLNQNTKLVSDMKVEDYNIRPADDTCFDLLVIATK